MEHTPEFFVTAALLQAIGAKALAAAIKDVCDKEGLAPQFTFIGKPYGVSPIDMTTSGAAGFVLRIDCLLTKKIETPSKAAQTFSIEVHDEAKVGDAGGTIEALVSDAADKRSPGVEECKMSDATFCAGDVLDVEI